MLIRRALIARKAIDDAIRRESPRGYETGGYLYTLVKMLRDRDLLVDRLAARTKPSKLGRPPSAVAGIPPALKGVK